MGLFSSVRRALLGRAVPTATSVELEVVGESHRQQALERICGGRTEEGAQFPCEATLVAEPGNPHDEWAVQVLVGGELVGYLRRGTNREWHLRARREGPIRCRALIVGGWDRGPHDRGHFGIRVWAPTA